nr:ATP synthase F0 subunit 8 [Syneta adamsi]
MPQMAPMNWLMLFFYFISIFLLFNLTNYFMFMYNNKNKMSYHHSIKLNWKW